MRGPWLPRSRVAASVLTVWIWRRKRRTALLDVNVSASQHEVVRPIHAERAEDGGVERAMYGALTQGSSRGAATGG